MKKEKSKNSLFKSYNKKLVEFFIKNPKNKSHDNKEEATMKKLKIIFTDVWISIGLIILFTLVLVTKWTEHDFDFYFWLLIISLIITIYRIKINFTLRYE